MFPYSFDVRTLNGTNGFKISTTQQYLSGLGFSVAGVGDINKDGFKDIIVGVYSSSSAYMIYGSSTFSPEIIVENLLEPFGFVIKGDRYSAGATLAGLGDINGDGFVDFAIGAPGFENDIGEGKAYVVFGKQNFSSPFQLSTLNGNNGFTVNGVQHEDRVGWSIAGLGNFHNNTYKDLIIGAPLYDRSGRAYDIGAGFIINGAKTFPSSLTVSTLGTRGIYVTGDDLWLGYSVAGVGDVNGDGVDDALIGSYPQSYYSGYAHLIFGGSKLSAADSIDLSAANNNTVTIELRYYEQKFSSMVCGVGDINKDGLADFIVSNSNGGYLGLIFGSNDFPDLLVLDDYLDGIKGVKLKGGGNSCGKAGDINNDGYGDMIVGQYSSATVVFGREKSSFPATIDISKESVYTMQITGDSRLGISVSGLGDVSGDGIDDFAVGSNSGLTPNPSPGNVYVVFGQNAPLPSLSPSPSPSVSSLPSQSVKPSSSNIPKYSSSPTSTPKHPSATPNPTTPSHHTVSPSPSTMADSGHDDTGAIVGGVIGAIASFAVLGFAGWWCYKNNLHTDHFGETAHLVGDSGETHYGSHANI